MGPHFTVCLLSCVVDLGRGSKLESVAKTTANKMAARSVKHEFSVAASLCFIKLIYVLTGDVHIFIYI